MKSYWSRPASHVNYGRHRIHANKHCSWLHTLTAFSYVLGPPPWVVYDVSAGRLVLRQQLLEVVSSSPAQATAVLVNACVASVGQLTNLMKQVRAAATHETAASMDGQQCQAHAAQPLQAYSACLVPCNPLGTSKLVCL